MTYLPYAGIGSRETPENFLGVFRHLGQYLFHEGWTLRSGAAPGADSAFEEGAIAQAAGANPRTEIYLPWRGFNNSRSELNPGNHPFTEEEIELTARFHPNWKACSPSARLLHQRNLRQLIGHPSISGPVVQPSKFVICWTEGGKLKGGTSQALRIAEAAEIPVINFGKATTSKEIEDLMLEVDRLQAEAKKEPVNEQPTLSGAAV